MHIEYDDFGEFIESKDLESVSESRPLGDREMTTVM